MKKRIENALFVMVRIFKNGVNEMANNGFIAVIVFIIFRSLTKVSN